MIAADTFLYELIRLLTVNIVQALFLLKSCER